MQQYNSNNIVYDLGDGVTWSEVNSENIEEAIELIADTFGQNSGNPAFLALNIPKSEIKQLWKSKMPKLVEKTADPSSKLVQMLFRYKGTPAAFFYTIDVHDEFESYKNVTFLNSKWEWKAGIDKHLIKTAVEKYPKRGHLLHSWMGVNSVTGFEGLARITDLEVRVQLSVRGWQFTGSNTYNPKMVRITARNKGYTMGDLDINDLEFEGRKVFKDYKEPMVVTYMVVPVDEVTNREYFPQVIPRYEKVKQEYSLGNTDQHKPKL